MSNNNVIEYKFILILSVNTTARFQVLSMIAEDIQVLYNAMLLEQCV